MPTTPGAGCQELRIFVSSAFRDTSAERELLATHVFPALTELSRRHELLLNVVDLRRGVTEVEFERGESVPGSVYEIDRCHVFIGLLGDGDGGAAETIPESFAREQPWLTEYPGRSVTELEMRHGVLNR